MFTSQSIKLVERILVIPLIGVLIAHGFLSPQYPSWIVSALDEVFASLFVIVAYMISHYHATKDQATTTPSDSVLTQTSVITRVWQRIQPYIFAKPPVQPPQQPSDPILP